jgi:hypothetical protein
MFAMIDAEADAQCATDQISELAQSESYERIPFVSQSGIAAMFTETTSDLYAIVTDDGRVIRTSWQNSECTGCENNENYSRSMGTPVKTAQEKRKAANCTHASATSDAFHLDADGACEECGHFAIDTRALSGGPTGEVTVVEEYCADCGTLRAT